MFTTTDQPVPSFVSDDGGVPGFALRTLATGFQTFIFSYRSRDGQSRRMIVGHPKTMTIARARKRAKELKALVDLGEDPAGERAEARAAPTVRDLIAKGTPKATCPSGGLLRAGNIAPCL
jgi:hypothetical protein